MLVDDDTFSRKLMGYYLKPLEAEVALVASGQACLDGVAEGPPDLILMDCQMPDMDGFETVTRLRANGYKGVILALTGDSDAETLERCTQVGMNGHLSKPVDAAHLRETILRALSDPGSAPLVEDPLARVRSIATAARNPALMVRLVAAFVKSAEECLAQLRQAFSDQDGTTAAAVAHRLRGSSGTFGAGNFSLAAGQLEEGLKTQPMAHCMGLLEHLSSLWPRLRSQLESSGGNP